MIVSIFIKDLDQSYKTELIILGVNSKISSFFSIEKKCHDDSL